MQIRQLIFQLSQTRVVSNRLILQTCRHFFKEPRNHTQIFEWVAKHLHAANNILATFEPTYGNFHEICDVN